MQEEETDNKKLEEYDTNDNNTRIECDCLGNQETEITMIRVTNHSPSNKKNQEEETDGNMQEPKDPVHNSVHEYEGEEN